MLCAVLLVQLGSRINIGGVSGAASSDCRGHAK